MNPINKVFLKLALVASPLYKKMGVNLHQLRAILHTKLTMDDRRVSTLAQTSQRKRKKPVNMATIGTMFLSAVMGVLFLYTFSIGSERTTQLTFYFSMFFFMLASTLISDFTSVLIDARDTFIILPKPVNDKTFLVARLLHIFIHVCKIVLPMTLPGIIYLVIQDGILSGLVFLAVVLLVTIFAIFIINAVYILILKVTTPNRFRTIISYFQIFFAIAIYAGYQIFPRIIGRYDLEKFSFSPNSSIVYFPFYWFASAWKVLYTFHGNLTSFITAFLGISVPVISLYVVIKYLAPSFNNRLAMINSSGPDAAKPAKKRSIQKKGTYTGFLTRIFTRTQAERMGFLFSWKMMSRSRDFKLKVYPGMGYMLVYIFLIFYGKSFHLTDFTDETRKGRIVIISALYLTSFILTIAIKQLVYSEKYKASWFFYTTPVKTPGDIILGAVKAGIFRFYIPFLTILFIASISLIGLHVIPNLILGLFNELLIVTLLVYAGHRLLPFSTSQSNSVKAGSFLRSVFVLFLSGMIAVGHYFVYTSMPLVIIGAVLSIIATWFMMSSIRNTSWGGVKNAYAEEGF
jgi:ABC-2 type transport system permease protein